MSDVDKPTVIDANPAINRSTSEMDKTQLVEGTEVALPLDFFGAEQLVTMMSVSRRPPELPLGDLTDAPVESAGNVSQRDIDAASGGVRDILYRTISVLVRREQEAMASEDPAIRQGFEQVEHSARMLEHLHLLKTRGTL